MVLFVILFSLMVVYYLRKLISHLDCDLDC